MSAKKPYWYCLLEHFEKKRYFLNGLTVPFLIGARTIIQPEEELLTVDELLRQAASEKLSKGITVIYCGDINEYIIGLLDFETDLLRKKGIVKYPKIGNIFFPDGSLSFIDFEDLIALFNDRYMDNINKSLYSKSEGQWQPFFEFEIKRLNEVKFPC